MFLIPKLNSHGQNGGENSSESRCENRSTAENDFSGNKGNEDTIDKGYNE